MAGPKPWTAGRAFTCCGRSCNERVFHRLVKGIWNFFVDCNMNSSFLLRKVKKDGIMLSDEFSEAY